MSEFLNLVCPSCDAVSRLLATRTFEGSRCERCDAALFPASTVALDDPTRFRKHIVSHDRPVLVAFCAEWCGPCRVMAMEFEKAARRLKPDLRLATVDTDRAGELGTRYNVQAIPTMILFRHGTELARFSGSISAAGIGEFAAKHLTPAVPAVKPLPALVPADEA